MENTTPASPAVTLGPPAEATSPLGVSPGPQTFPMSPSAEGQDHSLGNEAARFLIKHDKVFDKTCVRQVNEDPRRKNLTKPAKTVAEATA